MVLTGIPGAVIDKITKKLGVQTLLERSMFDLAPTVQPVLNVEPDRNISLVKVRTSTGTFFTSSEKNETYITAISIDSIGVDLGATVVDKVSITLENGQLIDMLTQSVSTAVTGVDSKTIFASFPNPIKMKKGAIATLTSGSTSCVASIYGYEVD